MKWKGFITIWVLVIALAVPAMAENEPERHRLRLEFFLDGNGYACSGELVQTDLGNSLGVGAGLRLAVKPAFLLELKGAWMPFPDLVYYDWDYEKMEITGIDGISERRNFMISGSIMFLFDRKAKSASYLTSGITLLIRTKHYYGPGGDGGLPFDYGWESLFNIAFSVGSGHQWYLGRHFGIEVGGTLTIVPISRQLKFETSHNLELLITAGVGVFYTL